MCRPCDQVIFVYLEFYFASYFILIKPFLLSFSKSQTSQCFFPRVKKTERNVYFMFLEV